MEITIGAIVALGALQGSRANRRCLAFRWLSYPEKCLLSITVSSRNGSSHFVKIESLSHFPPKFRVETIEQLSRARVNATSSWHTSSSVGPSLLRGPRQTLDWMSP